MKGHAESSTPTKCIKTTNFLIANMAASDLIITSFALPREVAEVFLGHRRWLLKGTMGRILCKLVFFLQNLSTAVSMHSLVVIAIDRYRGIVFPFRSPVITTKNCKKCFQEGEMRRDLADQRDVFFSFVSLLLFTLIMQRAR